ncbi:MAG: GFA family protein [Rhizobiaceae bacterium]
MVGQRPIDRQRFVDKSDERPEILSLSKGRSAGVAPERACTFGIKATDERYQPNRTWIDLCPFISQTVLSIHHSHFSSSPFPPPLVGVGSGTLDEPSLFRPQMHIFASMKQPWIVLDDGLPQYEEWPPA